MYLVQKEIVPYVLLRLPFGLRALGCSRQTALSSAILS